MEKALKFMLENGDMVVDMISLLKKIMSKNSKTIKNEILANTIICFVR